MSAGAGVFVGTFGRYGTVSEVETKFSLLLARRTGGTITPAGQVAALRATTRRRALTLQSVADVRNLLFGKEVEQLERLVADRPLLRRRLRRLLRVRRRSLQQYLTGERSLRDAEKILRERHARMCDVPGDETPVLFAVSGFNADPAQRRFLLAHFEPPRTGFFLELWDETPGLVVAPRWVHELVAHQSGDIQHARHSRGKAVSSAYLAVGVDVAVVGSLWEPGASGPLAALDEAITAAKLLT